MKADIVSCTRIAYIHVSHSVRKLTGVKAHLDCPNPNLGLSMGKQHMLSHITTHFIFSLDFFCNHIRLLQQLHTTRKYAIWWSGCSAVKILWCLTPCMGLNQNSPSSNVFAWQVSDLSVWKFKLGFTRRH